MAFISFLLEMFFDPMKFIDSLSYMGIGMLGIFVVVGIIVFVTLILGAVMNIVSNVKANKASDKMSNK